MPPTQSANCLLLPKAPSSLLNYLRTLALLAIQCTVLSQALGRNVSRISAQGEKQAEKNPLEVASKAECTRLSDLGRPFFQLLNQQRSTNPEVAPFFKRMYG